MTKKHFDAIARAVSGLPYNMRAMVAEQLACELAGFNPRFDWDRFVKACVENGKP